MITVKEAEKIIFSHLKRFPAALRPLPESYGMVLREIIKADRDLPPFAKSVVDGIAIDFLSWKRGNRRFPILGIQGAGIRQLTLSDKNGCLEIMTGAVLPKGCNCVIPVEEIKIEKRDAILREGLSLKQMQFLRPRAADHKKGSVLLKEGSVLLPPQVSIAASVGKAKLKVSAQPEIAIISTGDELVDIDKALRSYQVRTSNSYAVQAALHRHNFLKTAIYHIQDDKVLLRNRLAALLQKFDIAILSGGVSMGKFDFVPQVLKELKVKVLFHKVSQRPGKPFWFGMNKKGKVVFALPGNPVSTQVCTYRYVLPALKKASGLSEIFQECAILSAEFSGSRLLTQFIPVRVTARKEGRVFVDRVACGGSGDFAALGRSDGFVELKMTKTPHRQGSVVPFYRW